MTFQVSRHVRLRVEVKDYTSPFTDDLVVPADGAGLGWTHNIVPMFGLGVSF